MIEFRPHPDRALPASEPARTVARRLYEHTVGLPLLCMHGHVDVEVFVQNQPFENPAELLVVPDHYVTRMLVSAGVAPEELGLARLDGRPAEQDGRAIWRRLCENWPLFRGTPSRYWLEHELAELFGIEVRLAPDTADFTYDRIVGQLVAPEFRPLALLDRFGIELLATTDPATADLAHHTQLRGLFGADRIIPTFRPDALVHLDQSGWRDRVALLGELTDTDTASYEGFLAAIRLRRQAFVAAGALATDHGELSADTTPMPDEAASEVYATGISAGLRAEDAHAFAAHMLFQMARMSCEDGLVMQLHTGVLRSHDRSWTQQYGPDTGFDIPVAAEYTRSLRPLLESFGHDPRFRLVLFTVDETTYSRELAPIAGAYPAVRLGAPWWFLDSPGGMRRFREAAMETAGFYNTSGFVDDTRALLSIAARHDLARRIDAGYLATLVVEHRLDEDEAADTAADLAYRIPKQLYSRCGIQ